MLLGDSNSFVNDERIKYRNNFVSFTLIPLKMILKVTNLNLPQLQNLLDL